MDTTNNDAAFWIAGYTDYLRDVVGAADTTQLRYLPTVRRFIATCSGPGALDWTGLSVLRVTEFIREEAAHRTGHGRTSPASATRSFLRFLAWRGVAPSGLDRAIPRIRRARHASLPTRLSSEQLERLLQRPAAPSPAAYRDRAILSLLAGLGLRAGEVATLELDDLDWHAGQLRLRAGKCRRERVLPLPQEVGAALAEYLQHGRPQHRERRVFLTLTDPARTVQAAAVSEIVQRNLVRAGIPLGRRAGAHTLRHTAASSMVNGGASFKEVADVLGHRSLQTTGIYAKLDLDVTRQCGAALDRRRAMSGDIDFDQHLEAYLAIRDALGLTVGTRGRLLHNFLDYTCGAAEPDMPIRAMTAVAWACDHAPPGCGDAGKAHRLMVARGFLTYLSAVVPGTEVPAYGLVAGHRRRRPYIFSDAEIEANTMPRPPNHLLRRVPPQNQSRSSTADPQLTARCLLSVFCMPRHIRTVPRDWEFFVSIRTLVDTLSNRAPERSSEKCGSISLINAKLSQIALKIFLDDLVESQTEKVEPGHARLVRSAGHETLNEGIKIDRAANPAKRAVIA